MFLNVIAMLGGMSSEGDDQEDEVAATAPLPGVVANSSQV